MSERLINIVRFSGLTVGAATVLPHNLTTAGGRTPVPDLVIPTVGGFTVTADATNVTVTRLTGADPTAVDVMVTSWHTFARAFGAVNPTPGTQPDGSLTPQPFVLSSGGGSGNAWCLDPTTILIANADAIINQLVQCNPTAAGFTITLPAITADNGGCLIVVKNTSVSLNEISIVPTGADTIDGLAGVHIVSAFGSLMFASDGTSTWRQIDQPVGFSDIEDLQLTRSGATEGTIQAGRARDSTGATIINSPGILTVDGSVNGANGLDVGALGNNTWYAAFVIDGPGVAVAGLFSLSATAPTLPASYTAFRRVGWLITDGAGTFVQLDYNGTGRYREAFWDIAMPAMLTAGTASGGFIDVPCAIRCAPTSRKAQFVAEQTTLAGPDLQVRRNGAGSPSGTVVIPGGLTAVTGTTPRMSFYLAVDAAQIIEYQNSGVGGTSNIFLVSFIDIL